MPVPVKMSDLFLAAASNSPSGTDAVGNTLDDYIRSHATIVRALNAISTAAIASSATTDISTSDAEQVSVTGTTSITSLGVGFVGCYREVKFSGVLTITHSAGLLLPGAANLTTAANDVFGFRCIAASTWIMVGGSRSNDPLKANAANAALTGSPTVNGIDVGYRGVPQTVSNAAYTFVAADAGKCRVKSNTTAYTYTVPSSVHAAGDVLTVVNSGAGGNVTLATGVGMVLQLSGTATTGNRTVAPGGVVTIYFDSPAHAFVNGAGVS